MAGDRRPTPLWMVVRNLKNRERARGRKKHEFVMCVTYRQRIFRHIPDRRCFLLGSPRHSGDLGRHRTGGYVEQCGGLAASLEWGAAQWQDDRTTFQPCIETRPKRPAR